MGKAHFYIPSHYFNAGMSCLSYGKHIYNDYSFLGINFLSDINECNTDGHNCHADANCTNTKGSFYCTCHTGYSGDGVACIGRCHTA